MKLKRDFAASVRKQLDRYPVWEPGAPVALGDYGVLRDKTLHKLGNIKTLGITFSERSGHETPYQFASKGTSLIGAKATGSVTPPSLGAAVKLSTELQFKEEHGIFITAIRSRVIQVEELREVALKLRASGKCDFKWKFVTELRKVSPGTVIMGSTAGTTLKIEAGSDLLEKFNVGALRTAAGVTFTGEAALQVVGIEGPILVDLCYLPRFWGGDVREAAVSVDELTEEPYARLDTHTRVRDDDASDDT